MLYIIPDYYFDFHCIADQCEDTCCAGWQIVIDKKSLHRYGKEQGVYAKELRKKIHWLSGTFRQDKEKRCAFLNDHNLCEMYTNLGARSLCRTCRMYPRHVEEFENVREISLSVSCPEVARMLMNRQEPVHIRTYEKEGGESWKDFDPFLYSMLQDAREGILNILQNRGLEIDVRKKLILGMTHDIQGRVNRGEMFGCFDVVERYQTEKAAAYAGQVIHREKRDWKRKRFLNLFQLERLREEWEMLLVESEALLYKEGAEVYWRRRKEFDKWTKEQMSNWDIHVEQLLVYFIFTYFAGAVYDGNIYAKGRMCVALTELMCEIWMARWLRNEQQLELEEMAELLYRFSREVEHSDKNLKLAEKIL